MYVVFRLYNGQLHFGGVYTKLKEAEARLAFCNECLKARGTRSPREDWKLVFVPKHLGKYMNLYISV